MGKLWWFNKSNTNRTVNSALTDVDIGMFIYIARKIKHKIGMSIYVFCVWNIFSLPYCLAYPHSRVGINVEK
jgi:uncharacterized protein (DUF486 family)